jgi:hypothetical protein
MLANKIFNSVNKKIPKLQITKVGSNVGSNSILRNFSIFNGQIHSYRNFKGFRSQIGRTFSASNGPIDHYMIMGLSKHRTNLTNEILSKRFKELSLKYHPDVNPSKNANQKYMQIKDSYEYLKDEISGKHKSGPDFTKDDPSPTKESNFRYYQRQAAGPRSSSSNWDFKTEEEYVFSLVFGYNWDEDVDRFMLTQHTEKRKLFIEKVIELRKEKFRQECEQAGEELDPPADKFGEDLDDRSFIQQAF